MKTINYELAYNNKTVILNLMTFDKSDLKIFKSVFKKLQKLKNRY